MQTQPVTDLSACDFYHTVELPDGSVVDGQWDLRATAGQYLGDADFRGKRVLEIGPASGFLSLYMESQGARVTAIEPPMETFWDVVPRAGIELERKKRTAHIARIRNSFWYLHHAFRSKVELVEASAYDLPASLGTFDMAVVACVLLHTNAPARLLASVAARGIKEIVVTEVSDPATADGAVCRLLPAAENDISDTWWSFSPGFFTQYLGVLGFNEINVSRHQQLYSAAHRMVDLFTVHGSNRG